VAGIKSLMFLNPRRTGRLCGPLASAGTSSSDSTLRGTKAQHGPAPALNLLRPHDLGRTRHLTPNQVPGNRLRVRIPCPPLDRLPLAAIAVTPRAGDTKAVGFETFDHAVISKKGQ
jgi:hypothetical protein